MSSKSWMKPQCWLKAAWKKCGLNGNYLLCPSALTAKLEMYDLNVWYLEILTNKHQHLVVTREIPTSFTQLCCLNIKTFLTAHHLRHGLFKDLSLHQNYKTFCQAIRIVNATSMAVQDGSQLLSALSLSLSPHQRICIGLLYIRVLQS